jgi:tetratricopeptide (TPR) repeat protein
MMKRFNSLFTALGPRRLRALFLLLASTGLLSLILNALAAGAPANTAWIPGAQTILALIFVVGAVGIVLSALSPYERGRWLGILAPSFGMVVLGLFFLPSLSGVLFGGAVGWALAGAFIFRPRTPMQYQQAVRHLRRNEYEAAVAVMDALIKDEPRTPGHYRFRAEILRVWGKLDRARRDYKKMTELAPDSAVAFNGLAEVCLQAGDYGAARKAGLRAYDLAPGEWVAAYNLGMIEDRLGEAEAARAHLSEALAAGVPDARHRLLIHLYLARSQARLGDAAAAQAQVELLKREEAGLRDWQTILAGDQAQTLREVLDADVQLAAALIDGTTDAAVLAASTTGAGRS